MECICNSLNRYGIPNVMHTIAWAIPDGWYLPLRYNALISQSIRKSYYINVPKYYVTIFQYLYFCDYIWADKSSNETAVTTLIIYDGVTVTGSSYYVIYSLCYSRKNTSFTKCLMFDFLLYNNYAHFEGSFVFSGDLNPSDPAPIQQPRGILVGYINHINHIRMNCVTTENNESFIHLHIWWDILRTCMDIKSDKISVISGYIFNGWA